VIELETENGRRSKYHSAYAKFAVTFVAAYILFEVAMWYLDYVTRYSSNLGFSILLLSFPPAVAIVLSVNLYLRKKFRISAWW
jgi:hypothetical protein